MRARAQLAATTVTALVLGITGARAQELERQGTPPEAPEMSIAAVVAAATPADAAAALDLPELWVDSISFGTSDTGGYGVLTTAPATFSAVGGSYLVLSSGLVSSALLPNTAGNTSSNLGGLSTSAGQDMVQMVLVLHVPPSAKSWYVNWKFLSEEYPEYVGSAFNDAFLIEEPASTFVISGNTITAPNNVAFDQNGDLISVNTTGVLGMTPAAAVGTTYDGATATLSTAADLEEGATLLTLVFSIMDIGDSIYDSTVFLDHFRFSGNPVGGAITEPAEICDNGIDDNLNGSIDEGCNLPPEADAGGPYSGYEGALVAFDAGGSSDPDLDELTYDWDFGDGAIGSGVAPDHAYLDNGSYVVCLTVTDPSGESDEDCTTAEIANVAPTVGELSISINPVPVDTVFQVSGSFSDPGVLDVHVAVCEFGDPSHDEHDATVVQGSGSGTFEATSSNAGHVHYAAAGVYTISCRVTDDDGDWGLSESLVVAYDPDAGFVTGGGWIYSAAGAYMADDSLEGKANFGFVSKYQKGKTVPSGNTEFRFQAAGLNFHSDAYEWLVVNQGGTNAQFKGSGTINGEGAYRFMLWAGDGSADTFRIRIWEEDEFGYETDIYDNGFDQELGGGSIVIHTK